MQNLEQFLRQTIESLRLGNFTIEQRDTDGYVDVLPFCTEFNVNIEEYLSNKLAEPELAVLKSSSKLTLEELVQTSLNNIWVYPELAYDFLFYIDMAKGLFLGKQLMKWFESQVIKLVDMCEVTRKEGDLEKAYDLMNEFLALKERAGILNAKIHSSGKTFEQITQKSLAQLSEHFVVKNSSELSTIYKKLPSIPAQGFAIWFQVHGLPKNSYITIDFPDGTTREFFSDDSEAVAAAFTEANEIFQEEIKEARKPQKGQVYFIFNKDCNAIKIGYSLNPKERLDALQAANSSTLTIIKAIKGDVYLERTIHKRFKHLRLNGEWFKATPELIKYIRSL